MLEPTTDDADADAAAPGEDAAPAEDADPGYKEDLRGALREGFDAVTDDLFDPVADRMGAHGVSRRGAVKALVGAEKLLHERPSEGLRQLVRGYGGKLSQEDVAALITDIAQVAGYAPSPEAIARQYAAVEHERRAAQADRRAALEWAQNEIQAFAAAKDGDGAPRYPEFERVKVRWAS
jgi:hypothetical protein